MPRIVTPTKASEPEEGKAPAPSVPKVTIESRLEEIVTVLHRLDRRDRMRTALSTVKTLLTMIPILVFLASAIYLYFYGEDLLQAVAEQTAQRAAEYSEGSMSNFLEQFNDYLPGR